MEVGHHRGGGSTLKKGIDLTCRRPPYREGPPKKVFTLEGKGPLIERAPL